MEGSKIQVLLVEKGAREHTLAWKVSQSPSVGHVYVAPGNGGTGELQSVSNIDDVAANDYEGLVTRAKALGIGLVVAGPVDAVVDGIEGYFRETANRSFNNYDDANKYMEHIRDTRLVIKVDGLVAGKAIVLPETPVEAQQALLDIMVNEKFGPAGRSVVIEEYREGYKISILTFSNGKTFSSLPPAQDHKQIFDGDKGPSVGGMCVYIPVPFVSPDQMEEIDCDIIGPTLR